MLRDDRKAEKNMTPAQREALIDMGKEGFRSGKQAPAQDAELIPFIKSLDPDGKLTFANHNAACRLWMQGYCLLASDL